MSENSITGKFDEASWQLLSRLGLSRSRFAEDGTGMAAVEQHIEFKRELRAGDLITIRSAVLEVKDKAIRLLARRLPTPTIRRFPLRFLCFLVAILSFVVQSPLDQAIGHGINASFVLVTQTIKRY